MDADNWMLLEAWWRAKDQSQRLSLAIKAGVERELAGAIKSLPWEELTSQHRSKMAYYLNNHPSEAVS